MNLEPASSSPRRGQLALTRLLPGGASPSSSTAVPFPARVPRKGEAFFAIAICYALAAAALMVVFPTTFAGALALWLVLAVPALVQMEIFIAAGLHTITAPTISGRVWFAALQIATCLIAASGPGWPRAVASAAVVLTVMEFAAGRVDRSARP